MQSDERVVGENLTELRGRFGQRLEGVDRRFRIELASEQTELACVSPDVDDGRVWRSGERAMLQRRDDAVPCERTEMTRVAE